ncbi:hypothetical protein A2U01_0119623, partial [Trifolium medium]|nr:hypothetical protein [Trifolium medium]
MARICDEDGKAKSSYYKAMNDRKGKDQTTVSPMITRVMVVERSK